MDGREWLDIEKEVGLQRQLIKVAGEQVRNLMQHPCFNQADNEVMDAGEMKANIMLAYRHLEDAAMRLGKVIQAHDGGKSVYTR